MSVKQLELGVVQSKLQPIRLLRIYVSPTNMQEKNK